MVESQQTMSTTVRLARGISALALVMAMTAGTSPALGASCFGASHDASLTNGGVSPSSGDTSTVFKFKVRYSDNASCTPASVTLSVSGVGNFAMSAQGGSATSYQRETTLPAGAFSYAFTAVSGTGKGYEVVTLSSVDTGKIQVTAPQPKPTASPKATPVPATPVPATPPPPPPTAALATPVAAPTTVATASEPEVAGVPSSMPPGQPGSAGASATPREVAGVVVPRTGGSGTHEAVAPPITGISLPWLIGWLAATGGGLAVFFLLGRRDLEAVGAGPATSTASGTGADLSSSVAGPPARRRRQTGDEAQIPRWLRPSVQAARYRTPGRPNPGE